MCNCNQKRVAYSSEKNQIQKNAVKVKLTTEKPMVLNGDITGRMYVFERKNDINWIDNRDVLGFKNIKQIQILY